MLQKDWFRKGTLRQQNRARLNQESCIVGVRHDLKGTLISQIYDLNAKYINDFKPVKDEIVNRKDKIRDKFKLLLEKVTVRSEKSYTKKYTQEMYINRKKELAMADTPCLEYYYDAFPLCKARGRVNYSRLIRTYTLRSRYAFDCLDTVDRVSNFKTPAKSKTISEAIASAEISTTPKRRPRRGRPRNQSTSEPSKRKRPDSAGNRRSGKRALILAPCDIISGSTHRCRYCNMDFNGLGNSESDLIYHCTGIPNSNPLPKSKRNYPKGLMKRLAEIGAVPDPGGDIL